jgi:hypothetical protein
MKKHHRIVWLLVVGAFVLAACGSPTPPAAPAQQPTAAPEQPALVPTKAPPANTAPSGDLEKLGSQPWKWVNSTDNNGKITTVQNPQNYTLTFSTADGTVRSKRTATTRRRPLLPMATG